MLKRTIVLAAGAGVFGLVFSLTGCVTLENAATPATVTERPAVQGQIARAAKAARDAATARRHKVVHAVIPTPSIKPDPTTVPRHVSNLEISDEALSIIMENEGLELEAYQLGQDWYVGYGHATTAAPGLVITEAEAEALLRKDIHRFERDVRRLVAVPLTEGQFSALVSFAYNTGSGTLARSSILRHINNGDMERAAESMMLYTKAHIGGEKQVLASLVERRQKERALFLGLNERMRMALRD